MEKKKNIILKEGFKSVVRHGLRSFTVESLAQKLSISKKTIYQFFPSKEHLIKNIIIRRMERLLNEFEEILEVEKDPLIQFIKIREHNIKFAQNINLRKLSYLKARYPAIWEIIEKYRMDRKEIYTRVYSSAKDEGYLNDNMSPEVCASMHINIFKNIYDPDFMIENNLSIEDTITHLKTIIANGIFNDRGRKKIDEISK